MPKKAGITQLYLPSFRLSAIPAMALKYITLLTLFVTIKIKYPCEGLDSALWQFSLHQAGCTRFHKANTSRVISLHTRRRAIRHHFLRSTWFITLLLTRCRLTAWYVVICVSRLTRMP